MRFPPSFLEEIRARLPASLVIGKRVKLKKQGREFAGLSPFNQERTPSFFVNDTKGAWFDFSAGKNGDIFTFLMEAEGLSFPEAVERLAAEAGVPMPERDPEAEKREAVRASLYEVLELAAKFFEESLQSRAGAAARGYLQNRGLGPELQRRFRIGYARGDHNALKEHLAGKDIAQDQMIAAGLLISGDDVPVSYDRFRERVIFPISDFKGRIVGFGGRALAADVPAKYLNSPETDLFHKGSLLYNGADARKAAHDAGTVIAVEGYVDAIQMVGAGFAHTVAPLGTALTERQLQILWRLADEPILCFDGDAAGIRAAHRAAELALPLLQPGKSLRFALLPEGQDPDDLIRAHGREAMEGVLAAASPLVDLLWSHETASGSFETPERRAALEARLHDLARMIRDDSVSRHYAQAFAERVQAFFPAPERNANSQWRSANRRKGGRAHNYDQSTRHPAFAARSSGDAIPISDRLKRTTLIRPRGGHPLRETVLVMTLLNHPSLFHAHLDEFAHLDLADPELISLRTAMLEIVAEDGDGEPANLKGSLASGRFGPLIARLDQQIRACSLAGYMASAAIRDAEHGWLQALTLHRRQRTLHKDLRDAEATLALEPNEANFARLRDIQGQMAAGDGTEALIDGFGAGREKRML